MNHTTKLVMILTVLFFFCIPIYTFGEPQELVLVRVDVTGQITDINNLPIYAHLQDVSKRDYALVMTTPEQLESAKISYQILDYCHNKLEKEAYFIGLERRKGARQEARKLFSVLHDDGRQILVRTTDEEVEKLSMIGFDLEEVSVPLVFKEAKLELKSNYNRDINTMIGSVKQETLNKYDGNLSGEWPVSVGGQSYTICSRYTKSGEPIQKATQYVYEFLQNLGLTVSFHEWSSSWGGSGRNVIGDKLGTTKPKEIVLVTAHMDTMPSSSTLSPGADDNGSGTAGVMLTAEILNKYNFQRTLRFVLFTGEEQGLYGSKYYAEKVVQDGDNIVAVYNMDMIAWDSGGQPTLRLHTRTTSNSGYNADKAIADLFIQVVNNYQIQLQPIIDADGISASDHASLWKKGFPGILAIEDDADDFCANYHTSKDKLSTLNMVYFTNYVKATVGTVASLAIPASR